MEGERGLSEAFGIFRDWSIVFDLQWDLKAEGLIWSHVKLDWHFHFFKQFSCLGTEVRSEGGAWSFWGMVSFVDEVNLGEDGFTWGSSQNFFWYVDHFSLLGSHWALPFGAWLAVTFSNLLTLSGKRHKLVEGTTATSSPATTTAARTALRAVVHSLIGFALISFSSGLIVIVHTAHEGLECVL